MVRRLLADRKVPAKPANGGSIRSVPAIPRDAELERATYAIFGMLNWIYGWYKPGRHGSAVELARSIHRMAMTGVIGRGSTDGIYEKVERAYDRLELGSLIAR